MTLRLFPIMTAAFWRLVGAQHAHHSAELPVLVDDARNPEAISDELAWAHFLAAVALEEGAPVDARRRQPAQLLPLGLEIEQQDVLKRILAGLKAGLNETERSLEAAGQGVQLRNRPVRSPRCWHSGPG